MTAWPFGAQSSVVRWSCVPTVVWMESWVGQAVPDCSRVGFRQESTVRHVVKVTRAPGRVHVRAYENRFYNQLCLAMLVSSCRCMESS